MSMTVYIVAACSIISLRGTNRKILPFTNSFDTNKIFEQVRPMPAYVAMK